MVNPFNPHTSENYDVKAAQDQVEEFTRPLVDNPTLKGIRLDSIQLEADVTNVVEHKLNRDVQGWYTTRIYDVAAVPGGSSVGDNMISLNTEKGSNVIDSGAWTDFTWDEQRVVGSSFSHALDTAPVTLKDAGEYRADATMSWRRISGNAKGFVVDQLQLQRGGGGGPGPGSKNYPFTTPANYTYDPAKIEVIGGVAKLLAIAGSGVYAHWHMNESAGINVPDSSGNGRHGITQNMEDGDWVAGKLNNCLLFDGTNEYVNCGNIANFERTDAFSVECWFKTSPSVNQDMVSRMEASAPYKGWNLQVGPNGWIYMYLINSTSANNYIGVSVNTDYSDGTWHHVVATYDGSSTAAGIHIYVDGVDKVLAVVRDTLSLTIQNAIDCCIGARGTGAYFWNGYLDEVVIYNKELSQDEAEFRYYCGTGREEMSLSAYALWHLNESSGASAADSSGNGRNGILVNMEDADWKAGKLNNCLEFNGIDEYVDCGNIAGFDKNDAFSLEFWVQGTNPAGANNDTIISKSTDTPDSRGWEAWLSYVAGNLKLRFSLYGTINSLSVYVNNTPLLNGSWHHVVITKDTSAVAAGIHIYIDDVDQVLVIQSNNLTTSIVNSEHCKIATAISEFAGKLDEVAIYDFELCQTDVDYRYNSGVGTESLPGVTTFPPSYPTDNPTIECDDELIAVINSWDGFIETTTKPAGTEVSYVLSDDSGVTWKYWNGVAWALSDESYAQSNTAAIIHAQIGSFPVVQNKLMVMAFLHEDTGDNTPLLDNIQIQYTLTFVPAGWEVLNQGYGHVFLVDEVLSHSLTSGFSLAAGEVPALLKVVYNRVGADQNYQNLPDGCGMVVQTVGAAGAGGINPTIREETAGNDDPTKYLQLLTDVDCVVDLWVF